MKTCIIIATLTLASIANAADQIERYNPSGTVTIPAPTVTVQTPPQQQPVQPAAQKKQIVNEFKKFDISNNKQPSAAIPKKKKVKKTKKANKKIETKALPNAQPNVVAQNSEPPRFIDIQAILAKGKAIQVEERKETSHAEQVEKATQKPEDAIKDMAKTVYNFIPGSIYTMWCKKGFITDIQLQIGESITSVNGGDTVRWLVEQTVSGGNGIPETQHVLIKPHQAELQTNIIISTDKHVYQLKAISTDNTYNPVISWTYPAEEKSAMLFINNQVKKEKAEITNDEPITPETLFFDYVIKSNKGMFSSEYAWTPVKVFNDGSKTYLQVNPQMKNNESPALFIKDRDGNLNLVNYRMKNNYFVIDRLFETAELRNGTDEIVTIIKESK